MSVLDSIRGLWRKENPRKSATTLAPSSKKLDFESRFERLRSSVRGTMSDFYVARDLSTDQVVGVKICNVEKVAHFENRFKGLKKPIEGEIAAQLRHAQVVQTLEYGTTTKGQPYLIMEFVQGPNLQTVIQEGKESELAGKRLHLIRQMASALQYVHQQGFIHRDICPRNYICLPELRGVKLIDFGLTVPASPPFMLPGNRTGTPLYMAPEIVRRKSTDKRVDVFSFGVTCYCLCTFEFPWPVAETNGRAALQHDTDAPIDIFQRKKNINRILGRSIMQCLHPNVAQRTESIDQFIQQIQGIQSETNP